MSIFKRIYGRKIPSTKMAEVEATAGAGEEKDTTPVVVVVAAGDEPTTTKTETTTTAPVENGTETVGVTENTTTTTTNDQAGQTTTGSETVPTTTGTTANGAPRSFQFGAKAKMFRDMIAQHRLQLDSDQTQLLCIVMILGVACVCSLGAMGTNYWQCDGGMHVGLWNTCQEQTTLSPIPDINSTNSSSDNSTTMTTATMCTYHNARNVLDLIVADQTRIDQIQAAQGLIVCGAIMCVASLIALVFAQRCIKAKPAARNMNLMRNLLVAVIFTQLLAFLLLLVGFFLYTLTERHSTSIGLLFVYFGLALFATNVINFITIEYKAYKLRQQQIQLN